MPAPQRAWVHHLWQGDASAFVARREGRVGRVSGTDADGAEQQKNEGAYDGDATATGCSGRDVQRERCSRSAQKISYNGWVRDLTEDGAVEPHPGPPKVRGRRARSAPRPHRRGIDLRVSALGAESTTSRRTRLLVDLEAWLADHGHPSLETLVATLPRLGAILKDFGQHLYSNVYAQREFVATLNAVRARYEQVYGRLRGAWSIVTAWQIL